MDTFSGGQRVTDSPQDASQPESEKISEFSPLPQEELQRELALRPYRQFLGATTTPTDDDKLLYLVRSLNPNHKLQPDEVLAKMRRIDAQFGAPQPGEPRLERIYRYVKLVKTTQAELLEGGLI